MKKLLLVIDVQNAFINDKTKFVLEKINSLILANKFDKVIFTRFINSYENICYKKLNYQGCISENDIQLAIDSKNNKVIDKSIYTAYGEELKEYIADNNIDEIYLCGLETECCVLKTAFDLFENEYNVYVLKDYCACVHGTERHNNAIEILKRNIGKASVI